MKKEANDPSRREHRNEEIVNHVPNCEIGESSFENGHDMIFGGFDFVIFAFVSL